MTDQQAFDVGKKIAEAINKDESQVLDHTSIGPDSVIIEGELSFAFLGRAAIAAGCGDDVASAMLAALEKIATEDSRSSVIAYIATKAAKEARAAGIVPKAA